MKEKVLGKFKFRGIFNKSEMQFMEDNLLQKINFLNFS